MKRIDLHSHERNDGSYGGCFGMNSRDAVILAGRIAEATLTTVKATVTYVNNSGDMPELGEIVGVIRSVVSAESYGFADLPWKDTDRLHITAMFEHFIPLAEIIDIIVVAE